jgi:hypothetical protein
MQVVHPILFAGQTMPDALYAADGLFRSGKFSNICGLILVPSQVWCFDDRFEGIYFPNPVHLQNSLSHPKPFEEMVFHETYMRKHVKWRDQSFRTSREPESWVPEAIADLIEGNTCHSQHLLSPNEYFEKIKRGEIVLSTQEQSKMGAYEMVKSFAWNKWSIPEERIQEY